MPSHGSWPPNPVSCGVPATGVTGKVNGYPGAPKAQGRTPLTSNVCAITIVLCLTADTFPKGFLRPNGICILTAFAHSRNDLGHRHELVAHLRDVASTAREFARSFGAQELGYAAGLFHDLGKFHPDFQSYLRWCEEHPGRRGPRIDHKGAGATLVEQVNPLLPLIISAHHGGLPSPSRFKAWISDPRVQLRIDASLELARLAVSEITDHRKVLVPMSITNPCDGELFLRFLFSCLVDADFLDTERHFSADRSAIRATHDLDPANNLDRLRKERRRLAAGRSDELTQLRTQIAETCERAGEEPPGLFRMTVPTGGGKTLAGMGFALRHAMSHGKRQVIVAVPYTTITEQAADVYRAIFGEHMVLEHHSAAQLSLQEGQDGEPSAEHVWPRLAAENWDAPIVVTTTVQLFQSLLGKDVSSSRKLHNVAQSVLILDEVQMLPAKYLGPILDVVRGLIEHFGVTALFSTATQPDYTHASIQGKEIAPDPRMTFDRLRRVRYEFAAEPWTWTQAVERLAAERQAMMVLNTKIDARRVLDLLGNQALHLSTNLCGAHRREVLRRVRERLVRNQPCLLVATQVVEAGVDIDFPAVYRAMGPLDRIIQAAGRCNREGRLPEGRMTVFLPAEGTLPPGAYRTATQLGAIDLNQEIDLNDPAALNRWFRSLYRTVETDADGIQRLRAEMNYPEVARRFRMIDENTEDIVVPYGDRGVRSRVQSAIDQLRGRSGSARMLLRRIQPYTVPLRRRDIDRATARGWLQPVIDGVWEWTGPEDLYDQRRGLMTDGSDEELLLV